MDFSCSFEDYLSGVEESQMLFFAAYASNTNMYVFRISCKNLHI